MGLQPHDRSETSMLGALGVGADAETVYASLVDQPRSGVAEVVERTGLSERRVRAALEELVDLTFLQPSRESADRLRVVGPQVALDVLVRRQEADVARQVQQLAARKAVAAEAVAALGAGFGATAVDTTERLEGIDAVEAELEILAQSAAQECLAVLPGGPQLQESLEAARPMVQDAVGRGIRLRALCQDSARNDPVTFACARWLDDNGGEVRTAPLVTPHMAIFDRKTAVVPIDPEDPTAGALCTREPGIVAALATTHETTWTRATPLGATSSDSGLSGPEHELLSLLAQGWTDQAAARRLGVGLRTVRRQMSRLMRRLGASSRFEAGLKAARCGWL